MTTGSATSTHSTFGAVEQYTDTKCNNNNYKHPFLKNGSLKLGISLDLSCSHIFHHYLAHKLYLDGRVFGANHAAITNGICKR
jgi:hypothetical protein